MRHDVWLPVRELTEMNMEMQFAPRHRRFASSFCTRDLTHLDPAAVCRSDRDACKIRNAMCMSKGELSDHCLCRPGSCATSAGVCVEKECTKDVAKVDGAMNAAGGMSQSKAVEQALADQAKLDDSSVDDDQKDVGKNGAKTSLVDVGEPHTGSSSADMNKRALSGLKDVKAGADVSPDAAALKRARGEPKVHEVTKKPPVAEPTKKTPADAKAKSGTSSDDHTRDAGKDRPWRERLKQWAGTQAKRVHEWASRV